MSNEIKDMLLDLKANPDYQEQIHRLSEQWKEFEQRRDKIRDLYQNSKLFRWFCRKLLKPICKLFGKKDQWESVMFCSLCKKWSITLTEHIFADYTHEIKTYGPELEIINLCGFLIFL